jgi:hypothetical protein
MLSPPRPPTPAERSESRGPWHGLARSSSGAHRNRGVRGARVLTVRASGGILSGMKGWLFALGFSLALTTSAGAQSPADWRAIASARDISLIENWAAMLHVGIDRAQRLSPGDAWRNSIENSEAFSTSSRLVALPIAARGKRACRVFEMSSLLATRGDDHVCRFSQQGDEWRLLKNWGEFRFAGTFYRDPVLGVVFLGDYWTDAETGSKRWTGPDRRAVGVLRMQSPTRLLLHLPEDYSVRIVQIDLPYRPVIARPPGR